MLKHGYTLLCRRLYRRSKLLLENGANVNNVENEGGGTPLYAASQNGRVGVVNVLLAAGANTDQAVGATPLYIASERGDVDIVNALLKNGAGYNIARSGFTALDFALHYSHVEIFYLLYKSNELSAQQKEYIFYQVQFLGIEELINFMQAEVVDAYSQINNITNLNRIIPYVEEDELKQAEQKVPSLQEGEGKKQKIFFEDHRASREIYI